jgi:hypothetical protein
MDGWREIKLHLGLLLQVTSQDSVFGQVLYWRPVALPACLYYAMCSPNEASMIRSKDDIMTRFFVLGAITYIGALQSQLATTNVQSRLAGELSIQLKDASSRGAAIRTVGADS